MVIDHLFSGCLVVVSGVSIYLLRSSRVCIHSVHFLLLVLLDADTAIKPKLFITQVIVVVILS